MLVLFRSFVRLNLLPATTTPRAYKPYVNLFMTKSAVYIPCFLRLNLPPSYNPPLCLQTRCKFCYDKICRINPMLFTLKSGSQLQPRPSAYKPRHCAYKTLALFRTHSFTMVFVGICLHSASPECLCSRCLHFSGRTHLLWFSLIFAHILHPQSASAVGACTFPDELIYYSFPQYLPTFCIPRVPLQ